MKGNTKRTRRRHYTFLRRAPERMAAPIDPDPPAPRVRRVELRGPLDRYATSCTRTYEATYPVLLGYPGDRAIDLP
jgi:hypothetical protein